MKKRLLIAAATVAMTAATLGMTASAEKDTCRSYLTGEIVSKEIGRQRPTALMIENDSAALSWQRGTSSASIMYEAMVEGGITRMMGIFEDFQDVSQIMPIRSCRPYFVYYAREFDAYYGHFGQVIYAVPILQMTNTQDIAGIPTGEDGQDYHLNDGSAAYIRDHDDVTGIYTNYDLIQNVIESSEWRRGLAKGYKGHYKFAKKNPVYLEDGEVANVVLPGFLNNHARFDYNEGDQLYYRSEFGGPQIDHLNGEQLSFKNIIIQECYSEMFDDKYLWTDPVNNGEAGNGWYITNGRAERITWQKENWSDEEPILTNILSAYTSFDVRECDFNITRYYDMDGNEIVLNPGKTFVEIVREQDANRVVISDDPYIDTYCIDYM